MNLRFSLLALLSMSLFLQGVEVSSVGVIGVVTNRTPLRPNDFVQLPLGAIEARGWLKVQLERMRDGLTGNLDEFYPEVVGKRNGWLGGDGDGWERGPYWLDGLVPLGHLLKDERLLAKARPWIDWTLANQEPSGYLGPKRFDREPTAEPGIQKTPREDWWPRMVMLKVLQQHYSATGDRRVIEVLLRYFRYQLTELPKTPLDHWSFWANRRAADNLMVVYWLYNLTGEAFLLDLGELIQRQTFPYTDIFLNDRPDPSPDLSHLYPYNTGNRYPFRSDLIRRLSLDQLQSFHTVNLAQGIKAPAVYFQQQADGRHLKAVDKALADLRKFHGQPQGMYGGDEPLHGSDPTQGLELCSVVEMMFSLETMLVITGNLALADHLERIAYNALPAQTTADYKARQYFQSANQVLVTRGRRNFYEDDGHGGTDLCFGLLTGYPCCTCNMHQGWPKFVQNLWLTGSDGGLAALVYGPSRVQVRLADDVTVGIVEETAYPFEETVRFNVTVSRETAFPLYLRRPGWATGVTVRVNGEPVEPEVRGGLLRLRRQWKSGDAVTVEFGAAVRLSRWVEQSVAVERGPLVYALRIEEEWRRVASTDKFGEFLEVRPLSPWNYGLIADSLKRPETGFRLVRRKDAMGYPWTLEGAPLELQTKGRRIPEWELYGNRAGPLPHSRPSEHLKGQAAAEIRLVPYGATRLRIAEFPVVE